MACRVFLKIHRYTTVCSQWSVSTASWAPHVSVMAEEFLAGKFFISACLMLPLLFSSYRSMSVTHLRFLVLVRECAIEIKKWFWMLLHGVSSMCLVNIDAGRHLSSLWLTTTECVMWLLAGGSGIIWHWIVEHYHSRVALETIIVGSFIRISS